MEESASRAELHSKDLDLYEQVDDPAYLKKEETFESWYENPIDLPGRWYLQAAVQLFKENRLARGSFVGLGRRLDLRDIICAAYLLAGASDDITTSEQVFNAEKYIGTPKEQIEKKLVPGGHIGLFMGSQTLQQTWTAVAHWITSLHLASDGCSPGSILVSGPTLAAGHLDDVQPNSR